MAKKPDKKSKDKKVEPTTNETEKLFCQYCRHHSNRPSFCSKKKQYVGRKAVACESMKEVK